MSLKEQRRTKTRQILQAAGIKLCSVKGQPRHRLEALLSIACFRLKPEAPEIALATLKRSLAFYNHGQHARPASYLDTDDRDKRVTACPACGAHFPIEPDPNE